MIEGPWVFELLRLFADGDACEELRWRVDGDGLMFYVDCSDTFHYATADCEDVIEAGLPELQRAMADSYCCPDGAELWPALWCARKRELRPMNVFYPRFLGCASGAGMPGTMAALFDAAGPARPSTLVAP